MASRRGLSSPLQLVCVGQRHKEFLALRILVENQGRLASGTSMNQERKGLTGNIYLNGSPLRKFKIYSLEMQNKFIQRWVPDHWLQVPDCRWGDQRPASQTCLCSHTRQRPRALKE